MKSRILTWLLGRTPEEKKITRNAAMVLALAAALVGVSVAVIFAAYMDSEIKKGLTRTLNARVSILQHDIGEAAFNATAVTSRTHNLRYLVAAVRGTASGHDLVEFDQILNDAMHVDELLGIAVYDRHGRVVAAKGRFAPSSALAAAVNMAPYRAVLRFWDDKFVLSLASPLMDGRVKVGSVKMDLLVMAMSQILFDYEGLGDTGEMVICAPAAAGRFKCFPTRYRPHGYEAPRVFNGRVLPMSHALDGKSGVMDTHDYRGKKVLVTFAPFGDLGLGMMVKIDRAELRKPLYQRLLLALPAAAVLILLGVALMRWRLGPMVREVMESRVRGNAITNSADAADEWHWADLRTGLDTTLNIVWNEIKYKAEVKKEYGAIPEIECLPSQLNQVFMNLLVNAAHAIEERGVITIRSGAEGEGVWVEIADSGKGIPPEHLNRIFDPFFTTKPVGKGTGLGLSLAYGIVQKHHGRIEVQSEVGRGTTFRVWLPLRQPGTEADAAAGNTPAANY